MIYQATVNVNDNVEYSIIVAILINITLIKFHINLE